jgi:hypothetical protein
MKIPRWVAASCLVSFVAAGTMVATASTAAAIPHDCTISFGPNRTVSSLCLSGTGEHRIRMLQRHFDPSQGLIPIEGPWAPVGASSTTGYTPHQIVDVWIDKRG